MIVLAKVQVEQGGFAYYGANFGGMCHLPEGQEHNFVEP
jgi:hypothetical protein